MRRAWRQPEHRSKPHFALFSIKNKYFYTLVNGTQAYGNVFLCSIRCVCLYTPCIRRLCKQHSFPGKAGLSPKLTHPVPPLNTSLRRRQITNVNVLHHSRFSWRFQWFLTQCAKRASARQYPALYHCCRCWSDGAGTDPSGESGRGKGLRQASPPPLAPATWLTFPQFPRCPLTSAAHIHFGAACTLVLFKRDASAWRHSWSKPVRSSW